jgi:hypothetical protein
MNSVEITLDQSLPISQPNRVEWTCLLKGSIVTPKLRL